MCRGQSPAAHAVGWLQGNTCWPRGQREHGHKTPPATRSPAPAPTPWHETQRLWELHCQRERVENTMQAQSSPGTARHPVSGHLRAQPGPHSVTATSKIRRTSAHWKCGLFGPDGLVLLKFRFKYVTHVLVKHHRARRPPALRRGSAPALALGFAPAPGSAQDSLWGSSVKTRPQQNPAPGSPPTETTAAEACPATFSFAPRHDLQQLAQTTVPLPRPHTPQWCPVPAPGLTAHATESSLRGDLSLQHPIATRWRSSLPARAPAPLERDVPFPAHPSPRQLAQFGFSPHQTGITSTTACPGASETFRARARQRYWCHLLPLRYKAIRGENCLCLWHSSRRGCH